MGQRSDLETLREGLLAAFMDAKPEVMPQIAGQLRAVVKDLAALGEEKAEVSKADELAARRKARRSGAADKPPPARRSQSRRSGGGNRTG